MTQATAAQTASELRTLKLIRDILLVCGILSSVLYVGADILAAMSLHSYSYTSQSISELFAIGSPTRWIFALVPYTPLVIAFGIGVWWSAGRKRALRTTGLLLVAYGIASYAGSYFPMHQRRATGSFSDHMHILLTIVLVLLIFLFIAFGASASGKWFRFYSIGTILTLLVFWYLGWHARPAGCGKFADPMARNHGARQRLLCYVMGAGA
jgi:Protein of unknown function (DUF998)